MSDATSRAYQTIRAAILDGNVLPGSRLREEQLAAEIGVSRTPVREALRRLLADGLVESVHNSGTFVADLAPDDLFEVFELRALLEAYVARRAARTISDEQLLELDRLATAMEALEGEGAEQNEQFARLNTAFHTVILAASRSRWLEPILSRMFGVPLVLLKQYRLKGWVNVELSNRQHREIIQALRSHNEAWAGSRMESHLISTRPLVDQVDRPR
jgi:DNA-binding GntR family transcriptional regulator